MGRIAFISDIHGNLEALNAVIEDIKYKEIDMIICLGDIIAKGIHANECVNLVRKYCDAVITGNTDKYYSQDHDFNNLSQKYIDRIQWNNSLLSQKNKAYLKTLPFCYELYLSGNLIRVFHASPKEIDKTVSNIDTIEDKSRLFEPSDKTISDKTADIVLYGHIHQQYMDKLYNKTLINVGSVGNSLDIIRDIEFDSDIRETTNAHYVIATGDIGNQEYGSPCFI